MPFTLYCPIRKRWVADQPEERIRQALVRKLIDQLGFPIETIAVEKELFQLPHLRDLKNSLPKRRADLLIFAKNIHPLYAFYPILLIECKSTPINSKTFRQVIGYNHFVKAYFIGIVNETEEHFGYYDSELKDFNFQKGMMPYSTLVKSIRN